MLKKEGKWEEKLKLSSNSKGEFEINGKIDSLKNKEIENKLIINEVFFNIFKKKKKNS